MAEKDPKAMVLLIFALINNAKPNSMFYIETLDAVNNPLPKEVGRDIRGGYIASFFAPRTDISFDHHSITPETASGKTSTVDGYRDRLIVTKI